MLEHIDTSLIDWSRAQFALTAIYHWIFVPLTPGAGSHHGYHGDYVLSYG